MKKEKYPVLLAVEYGPHKLTKVWCPYCADYHHHGAFVKGETRGTVGAHCPLSSNSPFRVYEIRLVKEYGNEKERPKRNVSAKWQRHEALEALRAANEHAPPHVYVGRRKFCEQCGYGSIDFIHYKRDPKRVGHMIRLTAADGPFPTATPPEITYADSNGNLYTDKNGETLL